MASIACNSALVAKDFLAYLYSEVPAPIGPLSRFFQRRFHEGRQSQRSSIFASTANHLYPDRTTALAPQPGHTDAGRPKQRPVAAERRVTGRGQAIGRLVQRTGSQQRVDSVEPGEQCRFGRFFLAHASA